MKNMPSAFIFILINVLACLSISLEAKNLLNLHKSKRALTGPIWPTRRIPYAFSNLIDFNFESRAKIQEILKTLQEILNVNGEPPCLEFVERDKQKDYILFVNSGDCSSGIGYMPGISAISLSEKCISQGTVMHEIMHRLGFDHEHSRYDRDEHINVLSENILETNSKNFEINLSTKTNKTYESPYDFLSITHYNSNALQKNSNPVIQLKVPSLTSTNNEIHYDRDILSNIDIIQIQTLYNCPLMKQPKISTINTQEDAEKAEETRKRFQIEANFIGISDELIKKYLQKSFDLCGLDHFWPIDFPLIDSMHDLYQLMCQPKKKNKDSCRFTIECGDENSVCVRVFFKKMGTCFKTENEKFNKISQKINDQILDKGKKVKDSLKSVGKKLKTQTLESFESLKKMFGK